MALKGTLKDFGIADIFQLIGHQTKTGVLHLASKEEEVHIAFSNGNIVRADSASRRRRDLLGTMLVNAAVLPQKRLEEALEVQKRTLQRLGDILVEKGFISREQLKETYQLQVSETIYRLFGWKTGTYEFEQGAVEFDPALISPIRSDGILMEGFRRVDEWPAIRKVISSPAMTFTRKGDPLPPEPAERPSAGGDDDLDAAFGGMEEKRHGKGEFATLGRNERKVYALAEAGRSVQQIIDLSRLGEFEACKALLNLVNSNRLEPVAPSGREKKGEVLGLSAISLRERLSSAVTRLGMTAVVVGVVLGLAWLLDAQQVASVGGARTFTDLAGQHLVATSEAARIDTALAVYRLEKGEYPRTLDELKRAGLLSQRELRYPFAESYYYRRSGPQEYVLLPPIE